MRASNCSISIFVGLIILLHATSAFATDVVCELQLLGLDAVTDPLASDPGLFKRVTPYKPAATVVGLSDHSGFYFLQPADPRMSIATSSAPRLELSNMRFVEPYAIIEPGQLLTIINNSAYDLTFIVQLSGNSEEVKVPAHERKKVSVSGTDEGLVTCTELPYLKAFIVRSGPGYMIPLPKLGRGFSRSIISNVKPGTYSLKIWAGKWWATQAINITGEKTVLRMDIDATNEGDQVRAVENPPEEATMGLPRDDENKVKETPSTYIPPIIPATPERLEVPEVPAEKPAPKKKREQSRKPVEKPKKPAKEAVKNAAPEKPAVKTPEPKPAAGKEAGEAKPKKAAEESKAKDAAKTEKKPEKKEEKKEEKKTSAPSLFKIKTVDGE